MTELNIEQARYNMVEQQVRTWDVLDDRVLNMLEKTPREEYVPAAWRNCAYADIAIPLAHGQSMLPPMVEGRFAQTLELGPKDRVLLVGVGSGHFASILAGLCQFVYGVESQPELKALAETNLRAHGIENVSIEAGNGIEGLPAHAPFDAIVVTGSLPDVPQSLKDSLAPNGRLLVVTGDSPAMEARLVRRLSEQRFSDTALYETDLPRLSEVKEPSKFVF